MDIIPSSYHPILEDLKLGYRLPYTKDWSAAADFLQLIADHCLEQQPETILECSSGLTSLVLARCCQINNRGKVFSLENGEEYAVNTQKHITDYQLDDYASIIHAPLDNISIDGTEFAWYSPGKIPDCKIDMLVIDGPPGFLQKNSRYPALPLLFDRMSEECVVFLDDAARDDEKEIINLWRENFPVSDYHYIETERGCAVLKIKK